jgi:methionyl-tRNA synthetase
MDTTQPTPVAPAVPAVTPVPAPVPTGKAEIQYDDFAKIELKVATVIEAAIHPNADKLLVLKVDLGQGEHRQICAGIKAWYDPSTLVGKQVIVVKNLAPRPLRGVVSHGMLLAASDAATGHVVVLSPSVSVAAGSEVK